jgi:hypothetical protein
MKLDKLYYYIIFEELKLEIHNFYRIKNIFPLFKLKINYKIENKKRILKNIFVTIHYNVKNQETYIIENSRNNLDDFKKYVTKKYEIAPLLAILGAAVFLVGFIGYKMDSKN